MGVESSRSGGLDSHKRGTVSASALSVKQLAAKRLRHQGDKTQVRKLASVELLVRKVVAISAAHGVTGGNANANTWHDGSSLVARCRHPYASPTYCSALSTRVRLHFAMPFPFVSDLHCAAALCASWACLR